MAIRALLFDLEGILLDTNEVRVDSWMEAFGRHHYRVGRQRVEAELGNGNDELVASVLGRDVEAALGDALRQTMTTLYREQIALGGLQVFEGALELVDDARARGIKTALATSASREELSFLEGILGIHLASRLDAVVCSDDLHAYDPWLDDVEVACARLGLDPLACAFVGDSRSAASAARRSGVAFLGVSSGFAPEAELIGAGARFVTRSMKALRTRLDEALSCASRVRTSFEPDIL